MSKNENVHGRCASDACGRAVEPGERYCAECGLERSLFYRERRDDPPGSPTESRTAEPRR